MDHERSKHLHHDLLELDSIIDIPGEVRVDRFNARHTVHIRRRPHKVSSLYKFEPWLMELQPCHIKRTPLVSKQHNPAKPMNLDQKLQLINDTFFFQMRLWMTRQATGSTGKRHSVVTGKGEAVLEKIVKVLPESTIRAIDSSGVDTSRVVGQSALVLHSLLLILRRVLLKASEGTHIRSIGLRLPGCI